jgi:hypothetical protein
MTLYVKTANDDEFIKSYVIIYILRLFILSFPMESEREISDLVRFFFGEP